MSKLTKKSEASTVLSCEFIHSANHFNNYIIKDKSLIATVSKIVKKDNDFEYGMYRICLFGGLFHGKVTYAIDAHHLVTKANELVNIARSIK